VAVVKTESIISPDVLKLVDPDLVAAVPDILSRPPVLSNSDPLSLSEEEILNVLTTMKSTWALHAKFIPPPPKPLPNKKFQISCDGLSEAVPIHIIGAKEKKLKPAILHMHGGGFVIGQASDYLPVLNAIATSLDCIVVTVDYSLSPEHIFPTPLLQCYGVLKWMYENSIDLGIESSKIALQGESAGGGLAAMLAVHARNLNEVPICFQMLTHPMLDDRTGNAKRVPSHIGTIGWNAIFNFIGWSSFLGQPAGQENIPVGSVPARESDLSKLPKTTIWTGSIDLFVEENIEYARNLISSGVDVDLHVVRGAYHSFISAAPHSKLVANYWRTLIDAYSRAWETTPQQAYLRLFSE